MYTSAPVHGATNQDDTQQNSNGVLHTVAVKPPSVLALVMELCRAMEREEILYCHWKSNNALDRSASGDNDLDLLVSKADAPRFPELLYRLGFKQVKTPPEKQVPGIVDFFGYDEQAGRLVHVHAHFQLALGHDLTKNFRLPIETAYLQSSVQGDLFRVPAPEFEFIVFVVRMILKHSTWDVMLWGEGSMKASEEREFTDLLEQIDRTRVNRLLRQHLPYISNRLFNNCVMALQPGCSLWTRIETGQQLERALQANARRPWFRDAIYKLGARIILAVRRRVFRSSPRYRLQNGGMVALVGGDGAGKSTALDAVYEHFGKDFAVARVHMGKPAWSPVTIAVRSVLKIGQLLGLYPVESSFHETLGQDSAVSPGYPWLVREVCTARDRYWNYVKARRFAAAGGIVLCDRFPVEQVQLMDGPQCERFVTGLTPRPRARGLFRPHTGSRLTRYFIELEKRYYSRISQPELLVVLRLAPEVAVQRKTNEDADFVRERSTEIWEVDWEGTGAKVIDAGKTKAEVAAEVSSLLWSQLS